MPVILEFYDIQTPSFSDIGSRGVTRDASVVG